MGILVVVFILFALTGIAAAIWGFLRPPPDGPSRPARPTRAEPPGQKEP